MLADNEFIRIRQYFCETVEDDFNNGEVGEVVQFWNKKDRSSSEKKFKSVEEALKSVMEDNCLNWNGIGFWLNMFGECGDDEDRGRFDTTITVTEDNFEPTESQMEEWKSGNLNLYALHISVYLTICSERSFTDDEHSELI